MILVIGYGNPLRRDDGAGVRLAEEISDGPLRSRVRVETDHQLTPEMALMVAESDVDAVVFADAAVGVDDVRVERLQPPDLSPSVGHHLSPAAVMAYADRLYGRCPPAWIVTIPGYDLDHGEGLSERAEAALVVAHTQVVSLLDSIESCHAT